MSDQQKKALNELEALEDRLRNNSSLLVLAYRMALNDITNKKEAVEKEHDKLSQENSRLRKNMEDISHFASYTGNSDLKGIVEGALKAVKHD